MEINENYLKISDAVYGIQDDEDHTYAINRAIWQQLSVNIELEDETTIQTTADSHGYHYYSTSSGLQAAVYKNIDTGEIVIAYRGSDDKADIFADISIALEEISPQFIEAQRFYEAVVSEYCTQRPDGTYDTSNVTLTGHSLGGALAQLVAVQNCVKAYTYNAPGMLDIASDLCTNYNSVLNYSYITNYAIMNDYVGNYRAHVGDTYYIQPVPIDDEPLFDTHKSILNYTEASFGEIFSKPVGFGTQEALALWYYDKNNDDTVLKTLVGTQVTTTDLENAVNIINSVIGTPLHLLFYSTSNGEYIIGDLTGSSLYGSEPLLGLGGNDKIWGNEGNDSINGLGGNDTIYGGNDSDTIHGGDDNDIIYGYGNSSGAETLSGAQGNYLYGDSGNDIIWGGGAGVDYLDGGSGNDTLHATGTHSSTLFGGDNNDMLYGSIGNDILNGGDDNDTLNADAGNDSLLGSSGNDEIHGGTGSDTIYGNLSVITTGDGKNNLYGDSGDDYIVAGDSTDYIDGGTGDDILIAGIGNDLLIGNDGNDELYSGTGKSMLMGGSGDDTYYISMLNGLSDNDFTGKTCNFMHINGTTISDSDGQGSVLADGLTLSGGIQREGTTNIFEDELGFTYVLSGSTLTVSNSTGSFQIQNFSNGNLGIHLKDSNNDDVPDPESSYVHYISGTDDNDYLVGTGENDHISGMSGSDSIYSGAGNDSIYSGGDGSAIYAGDGNNTIFSQGNCTITSGGGNDEIRTERYSEIYAGDGNNTIYSAGYNTIGTGDGNDFISMGSSNGFSYIAGHSTINAGNGNNMISPGFYSAITAGNGNDTISAGMFNGVDYEGYSTINAGDGDNFIALGSHSKFTSGDGNDMIMSYSGNSTIEAGEGNNQIFDYGGYSQITTGDGNDVIFTGSSMGINYKGYSTINAGNGDNYLSLTAGFGHSTVTTGNGNDVIFAGSSDVIHSGAGNDELHDSGTGSYLYGGAGNDKYYINSYGSVINEYTNEGTDTVYSSISYILGGNLENLTLTGASNIDGIGNSLNNVITGNSGANMLIGGAGNDILCGGAGDDIYSFSSGDGIDQIVDSSGYDGVVFDNTVNSNNIAIYMDSNNNLIIDYGAAGGQDVVNVQDQAVEQLQSNSGYMTNYDINQLIQNMTAYASNNSIEFNCVSDVKNNQDLMAMVANSWHS